LRDEVGLCERVGVLLGDSNEGNGHGRQRGAKDAEERIKRYCGDCEGALHGVQGVSRGLL
jgi:hypothetical protein